MSRCPYGEPGQVRLAQYPCPGGCGCWVRDGNSACLRCWLASRTYSRREVAMLDDTDPRRARVRGTPSRPDPRRRSYPRG